jgi:hypothetical protein
MFQVFDDVELDAAALEQFKRAARITSARVVIKRHSLHTSDAPSTAVKDGPERPRLNQRNGLRT